MDRRNFLRQISLVATAAVVAPLVVTKVIAEAPKTGLMAQIENGNIAYYREFTQEDLAEMIHELNVRYDNERRFVIRTRRQGMLNFHKAMQKAALNYYDG